VSDVFFDRDVMYFQILSPQHQRLFLEANVGPVGKLVEGLGRSDPAKLATFRTELEQLMGLYFDDNRIKQDYLLTRAQALKKESPASAGLSSRENVRPGQLTAKQ
jgi:hypothetical protein